MKIAIPNYRIGDRIITTHDNNDFKKGDISVITDIQGLQYGEPLYITTLSKRYGTREHHFKLAQPNWKKRLETENDA